MCVKSGNKEISKFWLDLSMFILDPTLEEYETCSEVSAHNMTNVATSEILKQVLNDSYRKKEWRTIKK